MIIPQLEDIAYMKDDEQCSPQVPNIQGATLGDHPSPLQTGHGAPTRYRVGVTEYTYVHRHLQLFLSNRSLQVDNIQQGHRSTGELVQAR